MFNMSAQWTFHLTTQSFQSLNNESSTHKPGPVFPACNTQPDLIDKATAKTVERILHVSIVPLIELFGITTNVINLIVFTRQGLKDRINLCLFSLALADMSFLLVSFCAQFVTFLGLFDEDLDEYWRKNYLTTVLGPMRGTLYVSNLMTMIISVERCICVVSPFTAKKFLKTRNMAVFIVIMAIYILGVYSLVNLKYATLHVTDPMTNTSRWVARLSDFYLENEIALNIVYNYLLGLAIPNLSLIVVIITTSITVTRLRQTVAWRKQSASNNISVGDRREAAVTKMLAGICLIYVTTMTPSVTQTFASTVIPGYLSTGRYCNTFVMAQTMVHVCEVTNSSVNFIVYFTMGSRFRDTETAEHYLLYCPKYDTVRAASVATLPDGVLSPTLVVVLLVANGLDTFVLLGI